MIKNITRKLENSNCTFYKPGISSKDLNDLQTEFNVQLPVDFKELMEYSNGLSLEGKSNNDFNLFDLDGLYNVNLDEFYKDYLPNIFILGDDSGGNLYFYDIKNEIKKGVNSIHLVSTDELYLDCTVLVGQDLTMALESIINVASYRIP